MLVAVLYPGGDFRGQLRLVGDAAIEALGREHGEFGFGHVEPASVLGRVMPFEPFDEATRFGGGKGFVERRRRVRAEIVLNQNDLVRVGKMRVGQVLERVGVIDGCATVGDFHVAPALQRREHHEQIGHAIAFVFVVVTRRLARLDGDRRARLDDQLLRRFIEAYERALGITRPLVDFQHVFHVGDKGRAGLGSDHPLLLEMGLENVFLSVRPIVLSLALSTICSSTTFSSRRRRVHLAWPAGAGPQASAISLASAAPSKIRRGAEFGLYLWVSATSSPSSTHCRRVRSTLATLVSSASAILPSLQPSPASETSAFKRMRAFVNRRADRLPERMSSKSCSRSSALSRTTYFLTATSFPATNHLHRCCKATEIQNLPSKSMTEATRTCVTE